MVYPIQKIAEFIKLTRWKKCNFTVTILISKFSPCFCNLSEKPLIKFLKMFYQWSVQKKNKVLLLVADILKKQTWVSRASFEPCETQWHKMGLVYSIIFFSWTYRYLHACTPACSHPPIHHPSSKLFRLPGRQLKRYKMPAFHTGMLWNLASSLLHDPVLFLQYHGFN